MGRRGRGCLLLLGGRGLPRSPSRGGGAHHPPAPRLRGAPLPLPSQGQGRDAEKPLKAGRAERGHLRAPRVIFRRGAGTRPRRPLPTRSSDRRRGQHRRSEQLAGSGSQCFGIRAVRVAPAATLRLGPGGGARRGGDPSDAEETRHGSGADFVAAGGWRGRGADRVAERGGKRSFPGR